MKLKKVAIVSKVGSKESEETAKNVAIKFLAKKSKVYTIAPIQVEGAIRIESLEELKKENLDLVVTLGGDGTTLRVFRYLENETPILTINVGGNRGILAEITIEEIDEAMGPTGRQVSLGQAVQAMVLNGLGFTSRAMYLTPEFFQNRPVAALIGEGITAEMLSDVLRLAARNLLGR